MNEELFMGEQISLFQNVSSVQNTVNSVQFQSKSLQGMYGATDPKIHVEDKG